MMNEETPVLVTLTDRVRLYIVGHPGCQTGQIADALDIERNAANTIGMRLRDQGKVMRYYPEGEKRPRWKEGRDPNLIIYGERERRRPGPRVGKDHGLNQRTVTDWEPSKARDPLIDIFFGRNV